MIVAKPILADRAAKVWRESQRGRIALNKNQKDTMYQAYWEGVLPTDKDHSLHQWVEDGCPVII